MSRLDDQVACLSREEATAQLVELQERFGDPSIVGLMLALRRRIQEIDRKVWEATPEGKATTELSVHVWSALRKIDKGVRRRFADQLFETRAAAESEIALAVSKSLVASHRFISVGPKSLTGPVRSNGEQ